MRSLLAAVLISACRTPSGGAPTDGPAVIVHPPPQSRAALAEAVSIALNGARVTLADSALTGSSQLIIERMLRRDPEGHPVQGRVTEEPERFRLLKSGADCVLLHERTGQRYRLVDTECAPEMQ
ncbi:MAG: hypothetical protein E6J88_15550 [Deltaproteobacteria bacterium]|nr:MAG: hypothetical protein E6J88_15550 [Deltaproteobacteria bacterium]